MRPYGDADPMRWARLENIMESLARLTRWDRRQALLAAGSEPLSLVELGSRIKQNQEALDQTEAGPDRVRLKTLLDDMKLEFQMREFCGDAVTRWPATDLSNKAGSARPALQTRPPSRLITSPPTVISTPAGGSLRRHIGLVDRMRP